MILIWLKAIICGAWDQPSEQRYLVAVPSDFAWHYVESGWADYA